MRDKFKSLRRLVWLYFWLLMFEGAFRKWLLPGMSAPLLIIRDPVVIAIYALAFRHGVFPRSAFVIWIILLGFISFVISFAGDGTVWVSLFGLRANFLHLPLILLMPAVLRMSDILKMGQVILVMSPFMAALAAMQFRAAPESWWNLGAGGQIGGQLLAAEGKVRASGTFSFVTGLASYLAFVAAFLLYNLLERGAYSKKLSLIAMPALVLALVVSGSRTAVLSVAIVCLMVLYIALRLPDRFGSAIKPMIVALIAVVAVSYTTTIFDEGIGVLHSRFESGGGLKEGILVRTGEGFISGWDALFQADILGAGLGVGTNAGSGLMSGERGFNLAEGEWARVILESGPIFGTAYLLLRMAIFVVVLFASLDAYKKRSTLPLLMLAASGLLVINGQFGQPTTLGFAVFGAGLALAAAVPGGLQQTGVFANEIVIPRGVIRGRSKYAEQLHDNPKA